MDPPYPGGLSRARKFPLDNEMGKKFSAVISEKNPVIRLSGYPVIWLSTGRSPEWIPRYPGGLS